MQDVAADASSATDREMAVSDTTVGIDRTGSTGAVTVSLSWSGLASAEDGQLTVTEPFASGFEPERTFVVQLPDGYGVVAADPEPERHEESSLVWDGGTDLSGFELTVAAEEDDPTESDSEQTDEQSDADDDGPGFGFAVVAAGVIALVALALKRK